MKEQLVYVDRQNTGSVKWDGMKEKYGRDDLLCLWVADMDFKSPRCVQEALQRQIDCGAYGYSILGADFTDCFPADFVVYWKKPHQRRCFCLKLLIASDIHGSAYWAKKVVEAFQFENRDKLILLGDLLYVVTGGKINPLIGSAGVSAVPMAARVSQVEGAKYDRTNFLLMHAMGPNVSGVIGSAVAAGFFLTIFKI